MAAAAAAKQVAAIEGVEEAADVLTARRVKVKPVSYQGRYQPAVTALSVTAMVIFLRNWLAKREPRPLPSAREFYSLAILGFVLALLSDVSPRVGKSFSYLVLAAVVFGGTVEIWEAISEQSKEEPRRRGSRGSAAPPVAPVQSQNGAQLA